MNNQQASDQKSVGQSGEFTDSPGVADESTSRSSVSTVNLLINGADYAVEIEPWVMLIDLLRERLDLTGTKKGCDHGQCGACTVLVSGRRSLSCLTLAAQVAGESITTIEGLATGDELHPIQAAFIKHDAFQCGYCTPGQICSAFGLLGEAERGEASYVTGDLRATKGHLQLSDEEVRERMSGNICRCGAYSNIAAAVLEVMHGESLRESAPAEADQPAAV